MDQTAGGTGYEMQGILSSKMRLTLSRVEIQWEKEPISTKGGMEKVLERKHFIK
jgi:hypothetical protein